MKGPFSYATFRLNVWFVAGLLFISRSARADTYVLFDSDSGDYIGAGQHVKYTSGITVRGIQSGVEVDIDQSNWELEFAVPNYIKTFAVGNYGHAERAPFRSPMRPGIDIGGDGRGCNTIVGWFRVLEVKFDKNGTLQKLAIDFKQNCGGGSEALYGAVRINSTLLYNVNKPIAIAGPPAEATEGATVSLNGAQSFIRDGQLLSYKWLQISGPPVIINNSTSAVASFNAPSGLPLGGAVLEFKLEVTAGVSDTDSDTVRVKINSKNDPQTYTLLIKNKY